MSSSKQAYVVGTHVTPTVQKRTRRHREAKSSARGHSAGGRGASRHGVGTLHHHPPLCHPLAVFGTGLNTHTRAPYRLGLLADSSSVHSSTSCFRVSLLPTTEFPIGDLRSSVASALWVGNDNPLQLNKALVSLQTPTDHLSPQHKICLYPER